MIDSILKIFSGVVSYLSAVGIDRIIAKWVAAFTIAWEERASKAALDEYHSELSLMKLRAAENIKKQQEWWKKDFKK